MKDLLEELLVRFLRGIEGMWQHEVTLRSPGSQQRVEPARRVRTVQHGVGHPFVEISEEQLYYLHSLGFSWTNIAKILGRCQLATTHSPRLVLTHTIYC